MNEYVCLFDRSLSLSQLDGKHYDQIQTVLSEILHVSMFTEYVNSVKHHLDMNTPKDGESCWRTAVQTGG